MSSIAEAASGTLADRIVATRVPWSIFAVIFASTSVVVGVIWDIS